MINSIIPAISGLFGMIGNQQLSDSQLKAQRDMNERNIAFQQQQNAENKQFALDMWGKNNAYNTPQMQMERFKAAGLNPHLIYGQGSPGNASPTQYAGKAPEVQAEAPTTNLMKELGQATFNTQQQYLANKNLEAQTEATNADKALKIQNVAESASRQAKTDYDLALAKNLEKTVIAKAQADLNYTNEAMEGVKASTNLTISQTELNDLQKDKLKEETNMLIQSMNESAKRIQLMEIQGQTSLADQELKKEELKIRKYEATLRDKYGIQTTDNMILRELKMWLPRVFDYSTGKNGDNGLNEFTKRAWGNPRNIKIIKP